MLSYDPNSAPDPENWLAADEGDRNLAVRLWHLRARIKIPGEQVHMAMHVVVENQIAEKLECVTRAMSRLMKEGLTRHDAIHAVAWVLLDHIRNVIANADSGPTNKVQDAYEAAINRLTARAWLDQQEP